MSELNAAGKLFGEVLALRIVLQRVLAQMALQAGDLPGILASELKAALADLAQMEITDDDPARAEKIRLHAEGVLQQIHSVMRVGQRPM